MILFQNISDSNIPNLIAAKTFSPDKIVWIYPQRLQCVFVRMKAMCESFVVHQYGCIVDDSDPSKINASLKAEFAKLSSDQKVIYHLAGGPRSVVLQGLKALDEFHRESGVLVEGVIYDYTSQSFDVMYPLTQNNAYSCVTLTLDDMLQTDGNYLDSNRPLKKLAECKKNIAFIEDLKGLAKEIKTKTQGKLLKALDAVDARRRRFHIVSGKNQKRYDFPISLIRAFRVMQDMRIIQDLTVSGSKEISFKQNNSINAYGYINGGWLEDWLGGVLSELEWQGAGVGVQILIGHKRAHSDSDNQELDFLGVRKNHLVYWSCKHTKRLTPEQLFEIDSMRDEMCGDIDHTAAILHAGEIKKGMLIKAKRLGIYVVNVWDTDAKEQVLSICR